MVIGIVKVKMFDRILKTLGNVRHVSKNWKKFDFAGASWDSLGDGYSAKGNIMKVKVSWW